MQIENIEQEFKKIKMQEPRRAAELAYVIAAIAKKEGNIDKALTYGKESVSLFDGLKIETQEECAAMFVTVNGIALPDLIHSDVVKDRLRPLIL